MRLFAYLVVLMAGHLLFLRREGGSSAVPFPWKNRNEGDKARVRKAMDSILKAVIVFRNMGSAAASLDPSHVGVAWAGVNLVLQVPILHSTNSTKTWLSATVRTEWHRAKCCRAPGAGSNLSNNHKIYES